MVSEEKKVSFEKCEKCDNNKLTMQIAPCPRCGNDKRVWCYMCEPEKMCDCPFVNKVE